jgi:hypothetical protein
LIEDLKKKRADAEAAWRAKDAALAAKIKASEEVRTPSGAHHAISGTAH